MKIINVVGARPNFMKIAPIQREMEEHEKITPILLHTGQHYDEKMSKIFFQELGMPKPDIYLDVGSDTHSRQTAKIMMRFEEVCVEEEPDLVIVVGDVNSTAACAMVASKLWIPVAHVEAGLRSFDRKMPEEINRLVTDVLSDFLFTPSKDGDENLKKEGIPDEKIFFVGNVMIDTLLKMKENAKTSTILTDFNLEENNFALLTLHRPSNVDVKETFVGILNALNEIQHRLPIIFPAHPRTQKMIEKLDLTEKVETMTNFHIVDPIGYLDFMKLMMNAKLVLTDSGGIQEETTVLGVPCLTLRENTERPVTITEGTNELVGVETENILRAANQILDGVSKRGRIPALWDGNASHRIIDIIAERFNLK